MVAQIRGQPHNVAAVAAELAEEVDCRHNRFDRTSEMIGTCDECHWTPDKFIWRCRRCDLQVCSRCRDERYGG